MTSQPTATAGPETNGFLTPNVTQAVPFFMVADIEASQRYYVDGLGFTMAKTWIVDGKLRWCWLQLGGAALMLQERNGPKTPPANAGEGVAVCFQCRDALAIYREAKSRGIAAKRRPFVGNQMWVVCFNDPDGYKIDFESQTDVPEETVYTPTDDASDSAE